MKRILAVFAALCLAFGGLNALAEGLFDDVAGTWVMTRYIVDNRVIDDPAAAGSAKVVLFNEDGSAVVTINQNVYHGTWRQEGGAVHLLYDDGDQADFILNADQLVYQPEGQVQYFTRQVIYNESSDFKFRVMTDGTVEILGYSGASPTVNIPDTLNGAPVRVIATAAFAQMRDLISVALPASVDTVKPFAFYHCEKLVKVSLPQRLLRIGTSAFQGCANLTAIRVPEGVETLEYAAFSGCARLSQLTLPATLHTMEPLVFAHCQALQHVALPLEVNTLADGAFSGCTQLSDVRLPAALTAICGAPFAGCSPELKVIAPEGSYAAAWWTENK